jgi:carboxypeptidase family protein
MTFAAKHRIPLLAFWVLILFRLSAAQEPEKPLYNPTGNEATVTGTINVTGTIFPPKRIDMTADPVCGELNVIPKLDDLIVNENKLVNAFVYLKGAPLSGYRFPAPDSEVELQHRSCYYSPHVLGIRVGQNLRIVNGDPTTHNTHAIPKANPEWNQSAPPGSPPFVKRFMRAEILIPIKDNQHPWERAYVAVVDHPFFAVSDEFGRFEIRGLPPGTYTLVVWHERLGEQQVEITVAPGEIRNTDFTFDATPKKSGSAPEGGQYRPR